VDCRNSANRITPTIPLKAAEFHSVSVGRAKAAIEDEVWPIDIHARSS